MDENRTEQDHAGASRRRPGAARTFLLAMLYGVALMAALTNTVALVVGLGSGDVPPSAVPLGLLGWGIVLYVHRRNGWPPFGA
ncbi:MAG: hypothetical protein M3O34_14725 [Chloroflexota bacterium]|nr:hypothetical protein [Chloroflexota bacterium]